MEPADRGQFQISLQLSTSIFQRPYFQGCGKRGLVLNLPFAFLAESGAVPDPSHKGGRKAGRALCSIGGQ